MATIAGNIDSGRAAIHAGQPDHEITPETNEDDKRTALVDTIANLMHWAKHEGIDYLDAHESAEGHFGAEDDQTDDLKQELV